MGCSSQKDVQINEEVKQIEDNNNEELHISIKPDVIEEENQEKKEEQIEIQPPLDNENNEIDENKEDNEHYEKQENNISKENDVNNINDNKKEEEDKLEEEILEDIEIQEEEYNKILLGGPDVSEKNDVFNSKVNDSSNIKQIQRKSMNKKSRKKPFIISVVEDSNFKKIQIIINACSFRENTMPIWCPKGSYIKFKVKGKWRIDKLYPYTDSKGLPSNNTGGFGYGSLIGRIGNGDKFVVTDDKAVIVKEEGALFLKQLLPKNMKIEPEGRLEVNVYDGEYMDIAEINQRIGWIENNTLNYDDTNQDENNEKNLTKKQKEKKEKQDFERKLRNELNNLRMNPLIFYEKYISSNKASTKTKKYLELFNNSNLSSLNQIDDYYNEILSYFKLFDQEINQRNLNKNNVINYLNGLEGEIEYFLMDKFANNIKVKCKLTQKTNPKDIIIQCFFDKKYRFYIFNKRSQDLTINAFKKYYKDFTLIIMAFTFEDNSEGFVNNE